MTNKPDTWMPLYVADYLKDTTDLSTLEHGAYFLLLMRAWTHGGLLPLDETRLARIAGLSPHAWKRSRSTLLSFFTATDEGYRHDRVEREMGKAGNMIEQRRAAGRASAAARAAKREGNGKANEIDNGNTTTASTTVERKSRPSPSHSKKGSDNKLSGETPVDFQKRAFDLGVEVLGAAGTPAAQARSLVGKWRKVVGDERVGDLLEQARGKADPIEWVAAAVNHGGADQDALFRSIDLKYAGLPPVQQ